MLNDLDAIQARADAAMHHEGESDGYVLAQRWYQSAKDVPALVAELRVAQRELDGWPALIAERDQLRGLLHRHHEYLRGLTGESCRLCDHLRVSEEVPADVE